MTDHTDDKAALAWHRVASEEELPEGRVKTVVAGHKTLALTHFDGAFNALDNACPHQGGPLGEGSIEGGFLRCPWHGWDFHPCTGKPPGGYDDGVAVHPLEVRDEGIYVGLPCEESHVSTVSDVMVDTMIQWGVRHVFGMVGHSNLGLADAMRRKEKSGDLTYIGIRHEGAAAFAASAYGKLTGRPAACLTIAGPGATNLLTGMWDAKVDRAPILALTGQVNTQVMGPGAFQEVDLAAAFNGVAAFSQTVLHDSRHSELMALAVKNALLRRDVAHLIFPDEVQVLPAGEDTSLSLPQGRVTPETIAPPGEALDGAVDLLARAKRPVMVVGHGARFHMPEITRLAESIPAAVITTFKGKGLIPDSHPLAGGVLGRSGTPVASWLMNESDLLLVLGASFSDHTGISARKSIIQVDFDPMALGKFHPVTVPVWGEIGVTVELLQERLAGATSAADPAEDVAGRWALWRTEKERRTLDDRGNGVNSAAIFAAMNRHVPENAVIAVDVGNNTYSFGRYFECSRQAVLMSGYLGSIGFGYPAAMGAWAAAPDRPIVAVTGDGGFAQYMAEVTTVVKHNMNITHILINNNQLGKISKEQRAGRWDVWQTALRNPDFAQYAESCGAMGRRVTQAGELDEAMQEAFAHQGPSMVEIAADAELI